ncbi:Smr/MutS family protein [Brachyspira hyodysenteriae]|uniref:Smr domain protein Small MutS Related protein C-terminal region of the MutS2 protein n=1 Tax=Brachyspira hyodysenteriae (strain ATCC 49526 / WA1) TaxID=565034 RepID=A0A3B6VAM1_BRAHW|nr:Smr/MutS family protein [Brachyspira hyodysenteriae]ACN84609.1 putative Smr domain protein; Small MutS Related protein; C-terminal region of the MutS2 protein [Brachyspira hyodysenteriae WA1]KLI19872.1 DNA mismatch repair protein MutS [Brachyspira hyodysenteriae]KLI34319.1 DNA mismatch repair protein MutS [Brachyspira hyodysenteriae]KLI46262.1 DNA mismatch repair protein MutS [Brachyspira hyodysenteriae]MCZ9956673.1 Smr/MutS family protein [Brachyspira hyodysenteriae]
MSKNSEEEERRLFEFYLEHGYLPDEFNNKKENIKKEFKKYKIQKENNSNKENKTDSKEELAYTKEDEEMFLSAIENLDCTNHSKKSIYDRRVNTKFKPNIKNAVPKERLDLHGLTSERALIEIKHFIYECKKNKISPILIIHGKGFGSENRIPVLKNLVEYYLATEGKNYIKFSSDAPINLGGSGAKIIYLDI